MDDELRDRGEKLCVRSAALRLQGAALRANAARARAHATVLRARVVASRRALRGASSGETGLPDPPPGGDVSEAAAAMADACASVVGRARRARPCSPCSAPSSASSAALSPTPVEAVASSSDPTGPDARAMAVLAREQRPREHEIEAHTRALRDRRCDGPEHVFLVPAR